MNAVGKINSTHVVNHDLSNNINQSHHAQPERVTDGWPDYDWRDILERRLGLAVPKGQTTPTHDGADGIVEELA